MDINDLKKAGLKITAPRVKILEVLENSEKTHLSVDDIYRELLLNNQEVAIATIYRVLTQFESAGIVRKLNFDSVGSVFESADKAHHDHLVCTNCGKIEEFNNPKIESSQNKVAKSLGFKLTDHSLYLYGLCDRCN